MKRVRVLVTGAGRFIGHHFSILSPSEGIRGSSNSRKEQAMQSTILYLLSLSVFFCVENAAGQNAAALFPGKSMNEATIIQNQSQALGQPSSAYETVIGGDDLLRVTVFGVQAFDEEVRVSAKGYISLPLIGDVHVAGLTTGQAQATIQQKLVEGDFMLHPQVSVFEKEYASQGVSVLGEVQKPGVYPMLGVHRLFDVLSLAGGMTSKAGSSVMVTHRDNPGEPRDIPLGGDVAKASAANVEILPGDTVVVSRAGVVYVVGDVKTPMGLVMDNGSDMTVLKAIAMAGGPNPTAALNSAKIIRRTTQGAQERPLALKKILAAKAPDPKLEAEDIVFVPNSAAKGAGRRGLEAIVQSATYMAIYHPL
jgi:polysaccharide biosynthesis/export protein